jgi:hypothetical protein
MDELINDINEIISRIEFKCDVLPVEILNKYTAVISYILSLAEIKSDWKTETIPKSLLILNNNLWVHRDKYLSSSCMRRNKMGDHSSAYHKYQLTFMLSTIKTLKELQTL